MSVESSAATASRSGAVSSKPLNCNIGLLGHVDSGKTSLAIALSTVSSTAAFDKSPQSQQRGITLDLGFSAFYVSTASEVWKRAAFSKGEESSTATPEGSSVGMLQCTLVDCPGHASLLRTVLGGAQIIDAMVLVIDATKGIQAQTAECLVVGEVLNRPLVVAMNKVDAVQGSSPQERRENIEKMKRRLQKTFQQTRWPHVAIIEVSAAPKNDVHLTVDKCVPAQVQQTTSEENTVAPYNIDSLMVEILRTVRVPELACSLLGRKESDARGFTHQASQMSSDGSPVIVSEQPIGTSGSRVPIASLQTSGFTMLVDHCFALKGQGTVFTGTVLNGSIATGDEVFIPDLQVRKKIKGIQAFRKPVSSASRGDRIGISVAQFDASTLERALICGVSSPGAIVESASVVIAEVHKVRFHKLPCNNHLKYHVTIGHTTVMATIRLFSRASGGGAAASSNTNDPTAPFALDIESAYEEELSDDSILKFVTEVQEPNRSGQECGQPLEALPALTRYFAVVLLERPVTMFAHATLVATRLDIEQENVCRLAFSGTIVCTLPPTIGEAKDMLNRATASQQSSGSIPPNASAPLFSSVDALLKASAASKAAASLPLSSPFWRLLPIVKYKCRELRIDRVLNETSCIATGVISTSSAAAAAASSQSGGGKGKATRDLAATYAHKYVGFRVVFHEKSDASSAAAVKEVRGVVDSLFGQSGKVKLVFDAPVFRSPVGRTGEKAQSAPGGNTSSLIHAGTIDMKIKKYPYAEVYTLTQ